MDDTTKEMAKAVAEAFKPFAELAERLFGEVFDQAGGIVADSLAFRRQMRAVKFFTKIQAAINEAGFDPRRIRDNIGIPVLQEALLQDDDTLQEKYAYLIANAADSRYPGKVQPSFIHILKELTPTAAVFLDALYTRVMTDRKGMIEDVEFDMMDLKRIQNLVEFGPDATGIVAVETNFMIMIDVLVRNRLLNARVESENNQRHEPRAAAVRFSLSQLGASFLLACRRPITAKENIAG